MNLFEQIPLNSTEKDVFTYFPAVIEHSQIPSSAKSPTRSLEKQFHIEISLFFLLRNANNIMSNTLFLTHSLLLGEIHVEPL